MGKGRVKILYMFITVFVLLSQCIEALNFSVIMDTLPVRTKRHYILNSTTEYFIEIKNLSESIERVPPRISIKCEECSEEHPLLIFIRQSRGILSWELPIVIESSKYTSIYKETERTLCPYDIINSSLISYNNQIDKPNDNLEYPVILGLSTSSVGNTGADLIVNPQENFVIKLNESKNVEVSPSSSIFFLYEFPSEGLYSILLQISSNDDTCMIVSIQNISCPVYDLEQYVQYRSRFQTVTRKGGLIIRKEDFPNGFYVVLIVSGKDDSCLVTLNSEASRTKNVTLLISKTLSSTDYRIPILVTLLSLIFFSTVVLFFNCIKYVREKKLVPNLAVHQSSQGEEAPNNSSQQTESQNAGFSKPAVYVVEADSMTIETDSSMDEIDFDSVSDAEFDKDIFRMKGYLYLCDLARKSDRSLKKKSEIYLWNLLTVAIFYFLPVIQLAIVNQYQYNLSGEQDLCYYNFWCSHPLWFFSDFNHVFSNIGYIVCGSLFICITAMKEKLYTFKILNDKTLDKYYGIPQHFGLFYAMGVALIVEGVMSACYHICPNHYNFQFDTSFMYIICTLCMIKIYHTRHPDINASAYSTFFLLAGVIFIVVCGIFDDSENFRIVFSILHLSTCTYLSLQIYYMGRFKFSIFVRFYKELGNGGACHLQFFVPMFPGRLALLVAANACNWGLAIGSFFYNLDNFPSHILTIFMVNLMLYITFYIFMKFIYRERVSMESVIYILLSVLGWSLALYFFLNKTTSWKLSPSQSKLYNSSCQLLGFYDNHDIWHFISALALFFSFMVLSTLDDDLTYVHRSQIAVF